VKPPKNGKGRSVPMMAVATDALRAHRAHQSKLKLASGGVYNAGNHVCCNVDGSAWLPSRFTIAFARLMIRMHVPTVSFHQLRHSHAILGLAAGVSPKVMQERLGHSSVTLTLDTYSHVIPGMQAQAVTVMEDALLARH